MALSVVCAGLVVAALMAIFFSGVPDGGSTSTDEPGGVYTGPDGEAEGGTGGGPAPITTAASRSPGPDGGGTAGTVGGTGGTAAGSNGGSTGGTVGGLGIGG